MKIITGRNIKTINIVRWPKQVDAIRKNTERPRVRRNPGCSGTEREREDRTNDSGWIQKNGD
jgi:hypothetical protein